MKWREGGYDGKIKLALIWDLSKLQSCEKNAQKSIEVWPEMKSSFVDFGNATLPEIAIKIL